MKFSIFSYILICCYISISPMETPLLQPNRLEASALEKLEQDYEEFLRTKKVPRGSRLPNFNPPIGTPRPDLARLAVVTWHFRTLEEEAKSPEENFNSFFQKRRYTSALKYLKKQVQKKYF